MFHDKNTGRSSLPVPDTSGITGDGFTQSSECSNMKEMHPTVLVQDDLFNDLILLYLMEHSKHDQGALGYGIDSLMLVHGTTFGYY